MPEITLRKYHGLGNDYLIYDPNRNERLLQERQITALCRRNVGVGADGILYGLFLMEKQSAFGFLILTEAKRKKAEMESEFFRSI